MKRALDDFVVDALLFLAAVFAALILPGMLL